MQQEQQISVDQLIRAITGATNQERLLEYENAQQLYINYCKLYIREKTVSQYLESFKYTRDFFNLNHFKYINNLNEELIEKYQILNQGKLSNTTINKRIKVIIACYNYCLRKKYITGNYIRYKALPQAPVIKTPINENDIKVALNYLKSCGSYQNYIILKLMIATGLRTEETTQILNSNINFKTKKILLTHTKNGVSEYISIEPIADLIKEIYDAKFKFLFHPEGNDLNAKISNEAIKSFFARIKRKFNFEKFNPHRIRHFFGTYLYNQTHDIYYVSKALRHKSIEITKIYLDISDDEILRKTNKFNPLNDFE